MAHDDPHHEDPRAIPMYPQGEPGPQAIPMYPDRPGMPLPPRGSGNPTSNRFQCDEFVKSILVAGATSEDVRPPINAELAPPLTVERFMIDSGASAKYVRQWTVSMQANAREFTDIDTDPIPPRGQANAQRVGRNLQAIIEWSLGGTWDNRALVDVGDNFQWSIPAKRVRATLVLPQAPAARIIESTGQVWGATAQLSNREWLAEVSATLSSREELNAFSSLSSFTLTESKIVNDPNTNADLFYVPPFARAVAVYTAGVPIAAAEWRAENVGGSLGSVADLEFPTTTPRNTFSESIPGHAVALAPPAGYAARMTVVWTIRPS